MGYIGVGLHFVLWSTVIFIYFQFLRRCFKDANFSAIIQNQMEKPVGFLSREPRATLTSGLANIHHPSNTLYCNNTCWSWMIMNEFILYSALVFIYLFSSEMQCVCVCVCACVCVCITRYFMLKCDVIQCSRKRTLSTHAFGDWVGSMLALTNKRVSRQRVWE